MATTIQLRTQPAYPKKKKKDGRWMQVDSKNARIFGVNAMDADVEALGHGLMTDETTLTMLADLAAARRMENKPIKTRFGHPGISENTMGKQVGVTTNYRVDNGQLLYDLQLLESARKSPAFAQDPVDYILDMAAKSPENIATSVVIETGAVWKLEDGTEVDAYAEDGDRPENAVNKLPLMRPVTFYYTDLVQEGAVTHDGLFERDQKFFTTGINSYAERLFQLADEWRAAYNVPLDKLPDKLNQLLVAYMQARGRQDFKGSAASPVDVSFEKSSAVVSNAVVSNSTASNVVTLTEKKDMPQTELEGLQDGTETNPGSVDLSALETQAANLAASLTETSNDGGSASTNQALVDAFGRLAALEEAFQRLYKVVETVTAANMALHTLVKDLKGERVVQASVPTTPAGRFGVTNLSPVPPSAFLTQVPVTPVERQAAAERQPAMNGRPLDPTAAAMAAQVQRNQTMGYGAR